MCVLRNLLLLVFILAATTPRVATAEEARPLVVAHRGLLRLAPENTLANFRACLELRLGFEFDVQRTSDGHLVCIHDNTVDRTTNGTGRVAELELDYLRRLDAGSWFDPSFAGEKVPTVAEVLSLLSEYRRHDILVAVDLKAEAVEEEVVRIAGEYQVLDRLLFIGRTIYEPLVRERIKRASPDARTAAVANDSHEFSEAMAAPHADWVYVRFLPTGEQVQAAGRAGKLVFIAGPAVSERQTANWRQASAAGVHAILTDYPLVLRMLMREDAAKEHGTKVPTGPEEARDAR